MGLFSAYLKYDLGGYRPCLITFVNREAADEWWRMISTAPSPYATNVERVSPQFYFQNDARTYDVANCFSCAALPDAQQFFKKMFVAPLDNHYKTFPITLPPTMIADHISGRWYFVQSKTDPFSHWYLRTKGTCLVCGDANCDAVHVSSEYRTRFCIRVQNMGDDFQVPENFVMIGRDEISIVALKDYALHVSDAGDLKATKGYQGETDLLFGDLEQRFISRAEKQVNGEVWEYIESVERGVGEVWELVK